MDAKSPLRRDFTNFHQPLRNFYPWKYYNLYILFCSFPFALLCFHFFYRVEPKKRGDMFSGITKITYSLNNNNNNNDNNNSSNNTRLLVAMTQPSKPSFNFMTSVLNVNMTEGTRTCAWLNVSFWSFILEGLLKFLSVLNEIGTCVFFYSLGLKPCRLIFRST